MTTIEQEIQALDEQQAALDETRNALLAKRRALYKRQQEALIAAAGDVKAGDLVIIRSTYGDAKAGTLWLVKTRYHDSDYDIETVRLEQSSGVICIPLSCVIRIPDESAAGLWLAIHQNKKELFRIVQETLHMWADI